MIGKGRDWLQVRVHCDGDRPMTDNLFTSIHYPPSRSCQTKRIVKISNYPRNYRVAEENLALLTHIQPKSAKRTPSLSTLQCISFDCVIVCSQEPFTLLVQANIHFDRIFIIRTDKTFANRMSIWRHLPLKALKPAGTVFQTQLQFKCLWKCLKSSDLHGINNNTKNFENFEFSSDSDFRSAKDIRAPPRVRIFRTK